MSRKSLNPANQGSDIFYRYPPKMMCIRSEIALLIFILPVMYRQYSLLLVFPLLITFGFLYLQLDEENPETIQEDHGLAINRVIGDESFIQTYGIKPDKDVPERIRIKTHLQYVEQLLRSRSLDHLSDEQKMNRARHLDHLREYIFAGKFPHNDGHPDARRPTFISHHGHICAVGYLIEQDLGRETVDTINQKFKYDYITEIDDPTFVKWAKKSGFTLRELAMIQPAYRPAVVEEIEQNEHQIDLSYGIGSSVLMSANVLYQTNNSKNPWLFNDAPSNHWFGLAAGGGSILLGALNLDSKHSYTESIGNEDACWGFNCPPLRKVTATNHTRKALSIANMGVGLVSIVRSGYHLIKGTREESQSHSKKSLRVTQLEPHPITSGERIPAVEFHVRF